MEKSNIFQIVILGIFIFFLVTAVLIFAGIGGFGTSSPPIGKVVIWGSFDERVWNDLLFELESEEPELFGEVTYVEIRPEVFDSKLVEALASGTGPDLFFLPHNLLVRHSDKTFHIPYESFSERKFKDVFIEEGELFLAQDGIIAFPFVVDPLVLYWNRNHFSNARIASPPAYWDELVTQSLKLTKRDTAGNVVHSAIALGEFVNVSHAKEILSALIIQTGNSIVAEDENETLTSTLVVPLVGNQTSQTESALRFYTEFANPTSPSYSWNRSLPNSQKAFIAGDVATYIGFSSELGTIRRENPNLNFDVALLPQVREQSVATTYGNMYALAISRTAPKLSNIDGLFAVVLALTGNTAPEQFSVKSNLIPAQRIILANPPAEDAFRITFYNSALMARGWLDPDPTQTADIFKFMIESITSGRLRIAEVATAAQTELANLLAEIQQQ